MSDLLRKLLDLLDKIPWLRAVKRRMFSWFADALGTLFKHYGCPNSRRTNKLQMKKAILQTKVSK